MARNRKFKLQKLLGTTTAAELGNLDQERKNLRSTQDKQEDAGLQKSMN